MTGKIRHPRKKGGREKIIQKDTIMSRSTEMEKERRKEQTEEKKEEIPKGEKRKMSRSFATIDKDVRMTKRGNKGLWRSQTKEHNCQKYTGKITK